MSRFFDDKVLSDDQICEEACENGQVSPESRYNDYRNRLPFHYIEDGENDGYYYWTYGATMELSIILSDDVAWGEDKPVSEIEVDDELSETSENPVQNKVITKALNGKLDKSTEKTILDQAYIKTAAGDNSRLNISIEQLPLTLVERDIHGHVMTSRADSEGQAVAYEQLKRAYAELNENIIKNPEKNYAIFKGNFASTTSYIDSVTIDWGDGSTETIAAGRIYSHTYTDGIAYHIITTEPTLINFSGKEGLIKLSLGNKNTYVGGYFNTCPELISVILPDSGMTALNGPAELFTGCTKLKSIEIGSSIKTIGPATFYDSGIEYIYIKKEDAVINADSSIFAGANALKKIIVPKNLINEYKAAQGWSTVANKIVYEIDSSDIDSAIIDLDKEHIAYVNKENTFTERQEFKILSNPEDPEDNTWYHGYIDASAVNVSKDVSGYGTDEDATLTPRSLKLTRRLNAESGSTQYRIQLDLDGIKRAEYVNHVLANYGYLFPKTYPNQNVTLATIEDLNAAQSDYNQNDSTARDYIKNRPFYEETTLTELANFKVISGNLKEVGSEVTVEYNGERFTGTVTGETGDYSLEIESQQSSFGLQMNITDEVVELSCSHKKTYEIKSGDEVIFNGTKYSVKLFTSGDLTGKCYISDGEVGSETSSASFIYIFNIEDDGEVTFDYYTNNKSTTDVNFSLKTGQQTIKTIDPKFIKDMYYETTTETELFNGVLDIKASSGKYQAIINPPIDLGKEGDTLLVNVNGLKKYLVVSEFDNTQRAGLVSKDGVEVETVKKDDGTKETTIRRNYPALGAKVSIRNIHADVKQIPSKYIPEVGVQSDYNQNDNTQLDYIKNRPFYEGPAVVFDENVTTAQIAGSGSPYMWETTSKFVDANIGDEIKVVFNGVEYTQIAKDYEGIALYVGNLSLRGSGEDTKEPFLIILGFAFVASIEGELIKGITVITKTAYNDEVKIITNDLKTIDPKFIKDMYYKTTTETSMFDGTVNMSGDSSGSSGTISQSIKYDIVVGDIIEAVIGGDKYYLPVIFAGETIVAGTLLTDGSQITIGTDSIEIRVKKEYNGDTTIALKNIHTDIHQVPTEYIPESEYTMTIKVSGSSDEIISNAIKDYLTTNAEAFEQIKKVNSFDLVIDAQGLTLKYRFVENVNVSFIRNFERQFVCLYYSNGGFNTYSYLYENTLQIAYSDTVQGVVYKSERVVYDNNVKFGICPLKDINDTPYTYGGKLGFYTMDSDSGDYYKPQSDLLSLPEWITLAQQRADFAIPIPKKDTDLIDKKYADEIVASLNIQKGTGTSSIQQKADPKYDGVIKAATKNPYAKVLYPELTDAEPIGAIGDYAASFGGNSSVQAKRGIGGGTSSVTKGPYSQSLGDNTVTTPKASDSTAIGYQTTTDAPGAFTHGSYTVVMSQKYVEGMFDPSVEPGQGGSGQPTEPGTTPADTLEMDNRRGEAASAGGFNSYSSGFAAEVDGVSNVADGHISKSSGRSNRSWSYLSKTDGKNSVVKPDQTNENATGEGSWANGDNIQIIGAKYAYSGGSNNIVFAGADNSFSYGEGLQVKHKNQVVLGQYNDSNNNDLFVFGVGTGNSDRKNALRVSNEGKFYYGDFEVSNLKTTNDTVASLDNKLSPKITGNTTEITNLWKTLRDTNTNLNKLNEAKYDKTGGTIGGDVVITGDLTVNGTQHINNTENLNVENAMIYSNAKGATLATNGGIGIKKNATDVYGIVYDPTSDSVKLGLGKSDANGVFTFNANEGQPVAIRDDSSKFNANHFIKWNEEQKKLVDSGYLAEDFVDVATQQTIAGMKTFTDEVHLGTTHFNKDLNVDNAAVKIFDNLKDLVTRYKADSITIDNGTGSSAVQYVLTLPKETGTLLLNKFKYSTFGSSNDGDSWNLTDGTKNLEIKYQDANSHSSIFLEKDYIELSDINGTGSAKISLASNVITLDTVDSSDKHKIIRVNPDKVSIGNSTDTPLVEIDSLSTKFSNRPQVKDNGNYVNVALVDDLNNYVPTQSESADKYYAQITNENGIISARIFQNGGEDVQNLIISKDGVKVLGKNVATADNLNTKVNKLAESLRNQAYIRDNDGNDTGLAYTYTDEGGTLAVRNASGQLQVSDPSQDKDATNKLYADNLNARYISTSILGG